MQTHIQRAYAGITCLHIIHHINVKANKSQTATFSLLLRTFSLPLTNQNYSHHIIGSCKYSPTAMISLSWLEILVHRCFSVTSFPVTLFIYSIYNCFINNIANICKPKLLHTMAWVQRILLPQSQRKHFRPQF